MSKYKLIKKYPGSNNIGFIRDTSEYGWTKGDCENYPEFWEKVVEKDYEIICVKHKENKCFYTDVIDLIQLDKYDIHSVKRLSDGEIFTVGDSINTTAYKDYNQEIIKILVSPYVGCMKTKGIAFKTFKGYVALNTANLIKNLLFTTEDGVDISINDRYWIVSIKDVELFQTSSFSAQKVISPMWNMEGYLNFSTEKAAEMYVINNKPCLSIREVLNYASGSFIHNLTTLVKQKLKP
tara:strand:- start:2843 stop:3553 length:711 start_codon:yes stop_codon:yes gene_type:complete